MSDEFQIVLKEVISENFMNELKLLEEKRDNLNKKVTNLRSLIYNKMIKIKCKKEVNDVQNKIGKIEVNSQNGEINISNIDKKEEVEKEELIINNFNSCYYKNSLDVHKLYEGFTNEINENTNNLHSNLSKCNSDKRDEIKECIINSIRQSTRNTMVFMNKYNMLVDEKLNMLI